MLDLARAYDAFSWLAMRLGESGYVGHVHAENVDVGILDLLEALQAREKGAPEHCGVASAWTQEVEHGLGTYYGVYTLHLKWDGSPT